MQGNTAPLWLLLMLLSKKVQIKKNNNFFSVVQNVKKKKWAEDFWQVQMKICNVVLSTSWIYDNFNGTCRYEKRQFLNTTFTNIQRQLLLYCGTQKGFSNTLGDSLNEQLDRLLDKNSKCVC